MEKKLLDKNDITLRETSASECTLNSSSSSLNLTNNTTEVQK